MAHTNQYFPATKCIIFTLAIISAKIGLNSAAGTCPGFPGYCSESFPGQSCVVVCSRGRPNVPLCQSDGTWTDIPRCIEHDPGVQEQIPGLCPGIPGYCSASFIGHRCNFKCTVGPDIDSSCSGDGTWTPYPTCAGDLRETQDGCDGCPGPNGGKRNRTAEAILGITRPPKKQQDFGRNVRPSFAGNIIVGQLPDTEKPTKSFIPPQQPKSNFVPNLAAAGLRTTPRPTLAPTKPVQQFPRLTAFQQQQAAAAARRQQQQPTRQQPMVQQQQPRLPAQKFGRPSTQQPPRQQFTGQQSFIQNQNAQTNTQLSGPRQSTLPNQPRRQGGFSSQQLDIIRNGFSRLNQNQNGFGLNKGQTSVNNISQSPNSRRPTQTQQNFQTVQQQQPRQPVQQQPRQPVQQQPRQPVQPAQQQPRRPVVQQQPRQPVVQQQPRQPTPVQRAPQPQAAPRPAPTPARAPAPAPAPTPAAPKPAPKQKTLSAFERAILKNAGVTNAPDTIAKVERSKVNEPRVVQFLAEEPFRNAGPPPVAGDGFFGPFEVFQPGQPGAGGPLPDLRAFPAIPESARNAPLPIGADPAGFGIFETVNLG